MSTRIQALTERFDEYLEVFDHKPPFNVYQLISHRSTLALRNQLATAAEAARHADFAALLRGTLIAWGIGKRKSILVPPQEFAAALYSVAEGLGPLESLRIDDVMLDPDDIARRLWALIEQLHIVRNRNRLVACTKALHHLLPNLVPPMDREYTQTFFAWSNPQFQNHPERCFNFAFKAFASTARAVEPAKYVGPNWRTSPTKILDNAIVGYCVAHGLQSSNRRYQIQNRALTKELVRRAKELGIYEEIEAEARRIATRSSADGPKPES